MRLKHIKGAEEAIAASSLVIHDAKKRKGKWQELFENDHPIYIEIGMGKGQFLMELAKQNPQINYLGMERYSSVLLRALQKMEEEPLPNLYFLCEDAAELPEMFDKGELDRIYPVSYTHLLSQGHLSTPFSGISYTRRDDIAKSTHNLDHMKECFL